jgi:hypothetical protein
MPAPDRKGRLTAFLVAMAVLIATPLAVVAADAFTDVPDTNVFHEDIAWLAEAGVTKGCNPPDNTQFCPSDNVTREQMAAFMRRLATNQVVDAASVDGMDASELTPLLFADGDQSLGGTSVTAGRVEVNSVTVDAPHDGFLVVSGRIFINNMSGVEKQYVLNLMVDGAHALPQPWAAAAGFEDAPEQNEGNIDYTVTIPISAGSHTITQEAGPYEETASFFYNQEALTVVYYPNSIGSLSLSTSGSAGGDPRGR